MGERLLFQLRQAFAVALLLLFGLCMVNVLREPGLLAGRTIASFLPDLVSSGSDAMAIDATERGDAVVLADEEQLPPPPPPERLIIVDAGHGGLDGGTQGNGLLEKNWSLLIAQALTDDLRQRGFKVRMTRDGDDTLELADRTNLANQQTNHLLVSVHLNYSADQSVSGIETFYSLEQSLAAANGVRKEFDAPPGAPLEDLRSQFLAEAVQSNVVQVTAAHDRGKKHQAFFVLRNSIAPAVLVECAFVSNKEEAKRIVKSSYRKRLARGIANGITAFLNEVQSDPQHGVSIITPQLPDVPDSLVQAH